MWVFNWFKPTLQKLGIIKKNAKVVLLGLDDSGKSTMFLRMG
jgi:hypothetical protein